eukprot:10645745-Prorocentrum_lima.AAC.1
MPAPAPEAAEAVAGAAGAGPLLIAGWWGSFRITPKQRHKLPPYGGLQATCRWHAKSDCTAANSSARFRGPDRRTRPF